MRSLLIAVLLYIAMTVGLLSCGALVAKLAMQRAASNVHPVPFTRGD